MQIAQPELKMKQSKAPDEDELSKLGIGAAIAVHAQLSPEFVENVYQKGTALKIQDLGLHADWKKKPIPLRPLPMIFNKKSTYLFLLKLSVHKYPSKQSLTLM